MPLASCEARFKLMCTGPTDYEQVYEHLRESAVHRYATREIDNNIVHFFTRGRVTHNGNDVRQPFKLISTANCPRSEVNERPT